VLTLISVILLPLTLISGILGMNVRLPGEESPYAFPVVIGMMIVVAIGMLAFFRVRKWL
jgi:magnesium transporter